MAPGRAPETVDSKRNLYMPQIAVFELMQEISSFNPAETQYDDFVIKSGDSWLNESRGGINEIGGALQVSQPCRMRR